jgi:ferritin-like metal-binding protein YciE
VPFARRRAAPGAHALIAPIATLAHRRWNGRRHGGAGPGFGPPRRVTRDRAAPGMTVAEGHLERAASRHVPSVNLRPQHHYRSTSMAAKTIEDLFLHELSDVYSAEKQLTKALPKMARAATTPELSAAFEAHLQETHGQIDRIDQIVEKTGLKLKRVKCMAMEGLVEESKEIMDEIGKGPLLDAALIGAAQKVEHYEIASYGTLAAFAKQLGQQDALKLLLETLQEEKATDEKLTVMAQKVNQEAAK